jgi:hypothetical protein
MTTEKQFYIGYLYAKWQQNCVHGGHLSGSFGTSGEVDEIIFPAYRPPATTESRK